MVLRIGKRKWRHPSVLALVERHGRPEDPADIIRHLARGLVSHARTLGWSGPPFDPLELASLIGIRVKADELDDNHDACIYPHGQQLEIVFNATRPNTRRNFSITHEIAHTLFPDGYEMVRNRFEKRDRFDPDRELETLCDIGAAELLMPEDEFHADVERGRFGLELALSLGERYQASREAALRRMIQLDGRPCAAVFLERCLKPSEVGRDRQLDLLGRRSRPRRRLRILYSVASDSFEAYLPRHKSVPDDSCAYRALSSDHIESGHERWGVEGLAACHVEAMAMPQGDSDPPSRVVALLQL